MRPLSPAAALFAILALAAGQAHVIEVNDPAGAPYRQAVKNLMNAIVADDEPTARAAFAGKDDDLKLFDAFLKSSQAASRLRAALATKFAVSDRVKDDLTFAKSELRTIDVETIVVDPDKPNQASVSPSMFPACGYEIARVDGKWLVASLTSLPDHKLPLTTLHEKLAAGIDEVAARVANGDFTTLGDALAALRTTVSPAMDTYMGKRRSPPATRPVK